MYAIYVIARSSMTGGRVGWTGGSDDNWPVVGKEYFVGFIHQVGIFVPDIRELGESVVIVGVPTWYINTRAVMWVNEHAMINIAWLDWLIDFVRIIKDSLTGEDHLDSDDSLMVCSRCYPKKLDGLIGLETSRLCWPWRYPELKLKLGQIHENHT